MISIGIDSSLRSTGISILKDKQLIKNYIYQPKEKDHKDLIINSYLFYQELFEKIKKQYEVDFINLESLSFNSISSTKDVIACVHWNLQCILYLLEFKVNIVSPAQWRKYCEIIPKEKKQKEWKAELGKDYLKILAWNKLSIDNQNKILLYCEQNKLKKNSNFDLCEAFWIGCFEK